MWDFPSSCLKQKPNTSRLDIANTYGSPVGSTNEQADRRLPDLHMTFYGEGGVCNSFSTLSSTRALGTELYDTCETASADAALLFGVPVS